MDAFVAEAYKPLMEKWGELKQRHQEGKTTPEESLSVESEGRLELIYTLLSKDLIEKTGSYPSNGKPPVREFSRRIARETGVSEDFVYRYLNLWVEKQYLRYAAADGRISWSWAPTEC